MNLWLPDGTPVFMTPRYLHYACEIPYYPCDAASPEKTIAERVLRAIGTSPPPHFVMVYGLVGGLHGLQLADVVAKVAALLPEDVHAVTTDAFCAGVTRQQM